MVRLAYPADYHYPIVGSESRFTDAMSRIDGLNPDLIVWGGDQLATSSQHPEIREGEVQNFWDLADQYTDLSITHQIPGNHDIPTQYYHDITADYLDEERTTLPRSIQPVDGLTVVMMDTNGNGRVQGGKIGAGISYPFIPTSDLKFMIDEVSAAHDRGDVVVICEHAPMWPIPSSSQAAGAWKLSDNGYALDEVTIPMTGTDPETGQDQPYFICHNYHQIVKELSNHGPVVVLTGHLAHSTGVTEAEGFHNIQGSGIYHTWQTHFADDGTEGAYLDIDLSTGNVVMKTIPFGGGTHNTVMDVTPSW